MLSRNLLSPELRCSCDFFFVLAENREDMLNPANNKLFDVLEEANKLFVNGNIRH